MRLAIINPNSTASMTAMIAAAARAAAAPDMEIVELTNETGPAAIQGVVDGARAVPGLLSLVGEQADADAFVIACFDDTGLDAARCIAAPRPVVGIGEAGCHAAALLVHRFSIVTTLPASIPVIRDNVERQGFARRCASILPTGISVLDLEDGSPEVIRRLEEVVATAVERDGAEAIVLGCAGMAPYAGRLALSCGVPVVDGIAGSVGLASMLVRMRNGRAST